MGTDTRTLTETERLDWLRLYRSERIGPASFFRLIERFGSPGRALEALPELARRGGADGIRICSRTSAEREIHALERLGGRLIASIEAEFPAALRPLESTPLLTLRGNPRLLAGPAVAIVGARNASTVGRRIARQLAMDLGQAGFVVVSGMARGIDTAAHEGSLASGTVAVLAGGVDIVYPPENRPLYDRLCDEGCVVSEMAPGSQPQAGHFPRRNRLISGISLGVVVVEASIKSGSLITSRLGLEQGREIFAVPGSPLDPRCQGPNALIKQGAVLTETAADIIDVLAPMLGYVSPAPPEALVSPPNDGEVTASRDRVLRSLSPTPVAVDELVRDCDQPPAVVSAVLLELELAGRLERHPGNRVSLVP